MGKSGPLERAQLANQIQGFRIPDRSDAWENNKLGYLSLDIICSSWLTVFLELRSRKTDRFSEQIMSADKYPSIFSCQMEAIVYLAVKANPHPPI